MVMVAWILTLVFASPQAIIWRVLKHPTKEFHQCTTIDFFGNLSSPVGNSTEMLLVGLTPDQWFNIYHIKFNSEIFFVPLILILISYFMIFITLARSVVKTNAKAQPHQHNLVWFDIVDLHSYPTPPPHQTQQHHIKPQKPDFDQTFCHTKLLSVLGCSLKIGNRA